MINNDDDDDLCAKDLLCAFVVMFTVWSEAANFTNKNVWGDRSCD